MRTVAAHPTRQTLLLAIDRELSDRRRRAVERHLQSCDACRARAAALANAAADASRVCVPQGPDDASTRALRARLQQQMVERGAEWDRSLLFTLQKRAGAMSFGARAGISIVLVAALTWSVAHTRRSVSSEMRLPIEQSLPIARLTPGATATLTASDLCSGVRPLRPPVARAIRQTVLQGYRMEEVAPSEYELDYLITPELGGTADVRNLWPERYDAGVWNAHVKDDLEQLLARLVCEGTVDLTTAQHDIASNWIDAYKKYFDTDRPLARQTAGNDDDEIEFERPPSLQTAVTLVSFIQTRGSWSVPRGEARSPALNIGMIAWP